MVKQKIISQAAEAIIYLQENEDKSFEIIKDRVSKGYRIKVLDNKIRKLRTRGEGKNLVRASKVVSVPKVVSVDEKTRKLHMEFIDGLKLSDNLDDLPLKSQKQICQQIGESLRKLHSIDIAHGDLTTSNLILKDKKVYFIDFGLSFSNARIEDKAVDLHVLKEALEARHFEYWKELFAAVKLGYNTTKEAGKVFEHLKKVEKRGRYKH